MYGFYGDLTLLHQPNKHYEAGTRVPKGSVPVDFLRPKFRVAHTKHDVISILINKYTYINMYIIKKIISYIFILC